MAQSAELANAMSLPQATPAVGPEPLRPLQPLATTNLVTAQNAQNTISPLQVSTSSVNAQRTGSIQRLDEPSVEETHRSVVWGVPSTTGSEGLVPTLSSISAPPALVTSSDSRSSQPAILPQSLSAPITSPSVAPPIVVEPSRAAVSNSEQSVAASTASQQTPSFAPVTSQIASITPNATVYGTYNPSDYYANIATSSFPGSAEASDAEAAASRAKAHPKTAIIVVASLAGALFLLMFVLLVFVRRRDRRKMSEGARELLESTYGATISASPDPRAVHKYPAGSAAHAVRPKRTQNPA